MLGEADKGKLSAWERWELASFDEETRQKKNELPAEPVVVLPTEEEVEAIRRAAQEEGYRLGLEQGRQQGREEGYAAGKVQADTEAQRLAALVLRLDEAVAGLDQQVADELLALALEIARQVVRQTIALKPETVSAVLQEALTQVPQAHAMIHLHPDDASLMRSYLGDQLSHAGHRLIDDPRLKRGDCIIESGSSQLDASVATRWKRVTETLGIGSNWLEETKPR